MLTFRATDFEFRYRVWIISAIFCLGFSSYVLDHRNFSFAVASRLAGTGSPSVGRYIRMILGAGTVLTILGALLRSWASAYLHSSVVHDSALHTDRLMADGPYRHLRNPLYLGLILIAVGMGTMASRVGFPILAVGMIGFTHRLILREQAGLLESQGDAYRRFRDSVPGLLPALRPRVSAGGARPNWLDGFTGEIFTWGFAAAMVVYCFTGRLVYYWAVMAAGGAVQIALHKLKSGETP